MSTAGTSRQLCNPSECSRFVTALVPRIKLEVSVPNMDRDGQAFPQVAHVERFQALFAELCGGHAPPLAGPGRYQPLGGAGMNEFTVIITTYLPEIVTEEMKLRLLAAALAFGEETRQEEVLVAVGVFAFRFRFNVWSQEQERADVVPRAEVA